jgi:hypothetical protein
MRMGSARIGADFKYITHRFSPFFGTARLSPVFSNLSTFLRLIHMDNVDNLPKKRYVTAF